MIPSPGSGPRQNRAGPQGAGGAPTPSPPAPAASAAAAPPETAAAGGREKPSAPLRWAALQPQPAPRSRGVAGPPPHGLGRGGAGAPVRTEKAVVFPGALHAAVGQDLQVEARAAVELAAAQDAVQVRQLRRPGPAAAAPLRRAAALAQQRRPLPCQRQQEVRAHLLAQALQAAEEAPDFG